METKIAPVSKLMKNSTNRDISSICKEILKSIEDEVKSALDNCGTQIVYELPTAFSVAHFTSQRAQKYIYFNILMDLQEANYIVKIEFKNGSDAEKQKVLLHISWYTPEQVDKEKRMDEFIKSKCVTKQAPPVIKAIGYQNPNSIYNTPLSMQKNSGNSFKDFETLGAQKNPNFTSFTGKLKPKS